MTNADKIRQMNDEQLARFLWIWKINSVTTFLTQGGMNSMDAKDMREWVGQTTETFVCTETFVGDDYIFDQDFNDKADRKTEPTISKMEQVEDEPQIFICPIQNDYEALIEDEPQTETEIAKAIVHKMIDDAVIAEDAYPDLRQKMHDAVDEYEPQTDCAWK